MYINVYKIKKNLHYIFLFNLFLYLFLFDKKK